MARTVAKYCQVVEWIQQNLKDGKLAAGDKLESENEIGTRFGISRQTVRHALSILEQEGIIESRQGSGNYIVEQLPMGDSNKKASDSKTAVIVSTYVNGYIFPNIIQGMESILEKENWKIRIMFTHNQLETEHKVLTKLLEDEDVDGLIVEPTRSGLPNPNLDLYQKLRDKKIPIVFFHSYYGDVDIPHVSMNDKKAGYLATEHLIEQGHIRIGGIFKLDDGQGKRRYSGFIEAMIDHKLRVRARNTIWIDTEEEADILTSRERILKRLKGCTAFVCYNDTVANQLMEICSDAGIEIPKDLSLVSIDNSELARLGAVPLTSVIHPMEILGKKVAENMLNLMRDPRYNATYEFDPGIEIRNSVVSRK